MKILLATILIVLTMPISYAMMEQAIRKIRMKIGIKSD